MLRNLKITIVRGLKGGAIAGGAAIGATMIAGRIERGSAWEPVNAISHMVLGDEIAISRDFDVRQTSHGLLGHASAALGWGVLFALLAPRSRWPLSIVPAAAFTAGAFVIDYVVVPKRFTPGFEKVLSVRAVAAIYAALAMGLAATPAGNNSEE